MRNIIIYDDSFNQEWFDEIKSSMIAEGKYKNDDDVYEEISFCQQQEIYNLKKFCLEKQTDNYIVAVFDLGLWNGRKSGIKISEDFSLKMVYELLLGYDGVKIEVENKLLKLTLRHHDGVNYIVFREFKEDLSDKVRENMDKFVSAGQTTHKLMKYLCVRSKSIADYFEEFIS